MSAIFQPGLGLRTVLVCSVFVVGCSEKTQDSKDTQDTQDIQDTVDTQDTQDTWNTDDTQDAPGVDGQIIRKSASAMSADEIDRFSRAFEYAVSEGYLDAFNDSHAEHMRNRHHGADLLSTSPVTVMFMDEAAGFRLLPWHRSFIIEAELMLREALRELNTAEGLDPDEAEQLFLPYWDAAHDQAIPDWVLELQPEGGTATVPEGLPEGHAGYGLEVGERYDIDFGRWPGQFAGFETLQTPEYVGRILENESFEEFYAAVDLNPEFVNENLSRAVEGFVVLLRKFPENTTIPEIMDAISTSSEPDQADLTNLLFYLSWESATESRKSAPDRELIEAVDDVFSYFNMVPHARMHLYAGGLAPDNADIRGTVTYFGELAVDPLFWMLHGELDRYWYTWEATNSDKPPLSGDDALFAPFIKGEGAWYGGADEAYTLDELTDHDALSFTYDELFVP